MTNQVLIPQEVIERVNAELVRSILSTPDYIEQIVRQLLEEPKPAVSGYYNDPEKGMKLFDRILRRELTTMIQESLIRHFREAYGVSVDGAVKKLVDEQEKLKGTLADAFAKVLSEDYRINMNIEFKIDNKT